MSEKIPSSVSGPIAPPKRTANHLDRARSMVEQSKGPAAVEGEPAGAGADDAPRKLTTRVSGDQFRWLKDQAGGFKTRHPKRPRLTVEELVSIAIENLRGEKNLDGVIAKHRS